MHPYREALYVAPKPPTLDEIVERARAAIAKMNDNCPSAITLQRFYDGYYGRWIQKHGERNIVHFGEPFYFNVFPCCKEHRWAIGALKRLRGVDRVRARWRLRKERLLPYMDDLFQGPKVL